MNKKIKTILKTGLGPIQEGLTNHIVTKPDIEVLAEQRALICIKCPFYVDEPVAFLRVEDDKIPALSNKMCDECGCALALKTRQSIEVCKNWEPISGITKK